MKTLFEDIVIQDRISINTTAESIFNFLTAIVDDKSYRAWHKEDHVSFKWVEGKPWTEGAILYAEEYIQGKLHKLKFRVTKVVPNKRIEYVPTSRFIRKFFPKNEFGIEQEGEYCQFIASGTFRIGKIGKMLFRKSIEKGLASVRKHMREEGENLKSILESNNIK